MPNTLIIAPNWIGDAVMSEPLIRHLRDSGNNLSILATPWVAPVYRAMLPNSNVIEVAFSHGKLELSKRIKTATFLKTLNFDQAFLLPNSWKSVVIPLLANIPKIYGYKGELRSFFLKKYLANPPKKNRPPMVSHYLQLANLVSKSKITINDSIRPQLQVSDLQKSNALHLISSLSNPHHFYILAPGAEYGPAKQWPAKHFSELAQNILREDLSSNVILMGSPKDNAICEEILKNIDKIFHPRLKILAKVASLDQSIALISQARGLASNDSGLMHIAAALDIPQIAFFGSSDPKHTPPLSPFAGILFLGLDCSPCHQRKCPLGHLNCLNQIRPENAFEELHRRITLRNSV